jgi:hypothetical protein
MVKMRYSASGNRHNTLMNRYISIELVSVREGVDVLLLGLIPIARLR